MLEKQIITDQITVNAVDKTVNVRTSINIVDTDQDEVISTSYHRSVLSPGADTTVLPKIVQKVCAAVWSA